MNLLEAHDPLVHEEFLSDCLAEGFMGWSRMIIFYERFTKKKKEDGVEKKSDDLWIKTLEKVPLSNVIIFVGEPTWELGAWLTQEATPHHFPALTVQEMIQLTEKTLGVDYSLASRVVDKLGKKPHFVIQEMKKLKLSEQKWTADELRTILPDYREEPAFTLLNPLWEQNGTSVEQAWKRVMETADHELTMAMMTTIIRKVTIAAFFENTSHLPMTPSQRTTAKKLFTSRMSLKKLYDDIVQVDLWQKTGKSPEKTHAFLMALLTFCSWNSRS